MERASSWMGRHRAASVMAAGGLTLMLLCATAVFAVMASAGSTSAGAVSRANTTQDAMVGVASGAAADASGNVYATCNGDGKLRKIAPTGAPVTMIYDSDALKGIVVDSTGFIYAAEAERIIKFVPGGSATTAFAVSGQALVGAWGLAIDPNDDKKLYVANAGGQTILRLAINAAGNAATSAVYAGTGVPGTTDGARLGTARFNSPRGVAVDRQGNVWVADTGSSRIRRIDAGTGLVTAVAVNQNSPGGIAVDALGNVYFAATSGNVIRKIPSGSSTPERFAGSGTPNYLDSTNPLTAMFNAPTGVSLDPSGSRLLVAENSRNVRTVALVNRYHLATAAGPNGAISPASQDVSSGGNSASFAIAPNPHHHLEDVLVDGVSIGTPTSYVFRNVSRDSTLSAVFAVDTQAITSGAGAHGSIAPAGVTDVPWNGSQTYAIAASAHYHIADVRVDGVSVGPVGSYAFENVQAPHSISATFAADTFTLAYTAGEHGTIAGASLQEVAYGATATTVTAVPDAGYHFESWSDGVTTAARSEADVAQAISVSASFSADTYTLTYAAGAHGTIAGVSPQSVARGSDASSVTAVPGGGYHFVSWSDGVATATRRDTSVTADMTATASFAGEALSLVSAVAASPTQIDVAFSKPPDPATVSVADFHVEGVVLEEAAVRPDGLTVRLAGATQVPGGQYTVTVASGSVADLDGVELTAPFTADFTGHAGPWVERNPASGVVVGFRLAYGVGPVTATVPTSLRSLPSGFAQVPGTYFDISSTTDFSSADGFEVTVPFDPLGAPGSADRLRLLHWESGAWVDITTGVDPVNHTVSGHAHSFSDFVVGQQDAPGPVPVVSTPASSVWSVALLAMIGSGLLIASLRRARGE